MANTQLASLQKEPSNLEDEPQNLEIAPASSTIPNVETSLSVENSAPPEEAQTAALRAELDALKVQKAAIQASMDQALAGSETLKVQLADLARVNEQLMDDNESYQILVGERTLMGGFDIKQLLRVDDESADVSTRGTLRSSPQSSTTPSLEGVEEEDEDDADVAIERAVLESHGNGSRTTGAVEAGISQTPKPKRMLHHRRKESAGMGLDLAAELAQAEDVEVQEGRKKVEFQERKNMRKINKDKDQEIKTLKDTNKALVLYISKILDRISAHEGYEKVLSSDYANRSPGAQRTQSPPSGSGASNTAKAASANTTAANPAGKRSSWLQYFTGIRSPPVPSNIKPLRLGTGASTAAGPSLASAGLSTGWTGVKEQPEHEESDEESRARERRLAEMKLHGLSGIGSTASDASKSNDNATIRANRRSTSMYGANSAPAGLRVDENRRNSGGGGKLSPFPTLETVGAPLTQSSLMKRNEEREKESKMNLEKGQASGFTEIEIRGHRMRPSAGRQSTAASGSVSPILPAQTSPNQVLPAKNVAITTAGIKDLKMTGDLNHTSAPNDPANESIFARTARRISMMGGGK